MIRDIFTNKWTIGAIGILILIAAACYLYYHQTTAHDREVDKRLQQWIADKEQKQAIEAETESTQTPAESITPTAEKPINKVITKAENTTTAETEQTDMPTDTDEAQVSAYGFGPFPEVPEGMLDIVGHPFVPTWEEPDYLTYEFSRNSELMDRVFIKMWKEGDRDAITNAVGASFQYGKVYLNYPNTIYVWYEVSEDGDSISLETSGAGDVNLRIKDIESGNIPPDINIIDGETAGIDPYEYLDLNR